MTAPTGARTIPEPESARPQPAPEDGARRDNLLLLIQLRWIAVVGQLVTIAAVGLGLGVTLPVGAMATVLAGLVALNLASLWRLSRPAPVASTELALAMLFDVGALTLQLYLTGGGTNPFVFLYLLQVALGAVLLDGRAAWTLLATTSLCFAALTMVYRPLDFSALSGETLFVLHVAGMLVCFLLDAALLVVFVIRITRNLRERDARLALLRQQAAEEAGIVRMGLLASGAAHELGTPLATLSVILGDWRRMPVLAADPELLGELDVLESQVRRCKAILTGILVSAGETRGESAGVTTLHTFLDDLVEDWRDARPTAHLLYENVVVDDPPIVSDTALRQVIVNVLDNAFEASPAWVRFEVGRDGGLLQLSVTDRGPGFALDILDGLGTPYRSSKGRPGGGLGLFLVFNVVRKLGGRVTAANRLGGGAAVTLSLPLSALSVELEGPDGI
ncbi:MAG: ATP-binding protein [Janthinobacterium lividum]